MGPLSSPFSVLPGGARDARSAAREAGVTLEATLLSKLVGASLSSAGAGPEARFAADMFSQVIAEAVAREGGVGIGRTLEASLARMAGEAPTADTDADADATLSALLVEKGHVSSAYGPRTDPVHGGHGFHQGVDIAAPEGAPIRAARDGVVVFAGERAGYGRMVEIDHGDGMRTRYAHASTLLVSAGARVQAGAPIAAVGETGRATGPHLHFEVREADRAVDPHRALKDRGERADE